MLFALRVLLVLLRVLKKDTLERYPLWKVGFRKYFLKEQMISSCAPWFQRSSPRGVILQMVSPYAPGSRRRSPQGRSCSPASSPPSTPPPPPHPSPSGSPSRSTSETQESHLDVCLPYFWYQTILSCLFCKWDKSIRQVFFHFLPHILCWTYRWSMTQSQFMYVYHLS